MESKEMIYFKLFRGVCSKINESLELKKILTLITESAPAVLNAKGCAIYLLDKKKEELKVSSSHGLSEAYINKGPLAADKSLIASLQGETLFVPIEDLRVQYPQAAFEEGIASILSIPLSVKGNVIGVIRLYFAKMREFEEAEMEFSKGLADISALAIENSRMFSHLEAEHLNLINDVHSWYEFGARP